jgi:hypothetical protein
MTEDKKLASKVISPPKRLVHKRTRNTCRNGLENRGKK